MAKLFNSLLIINLLIKINSPYNYFIIITVRKIIIILNIF